MFQRSGTVLPSSGNYISQFGAELPSSKFPPEYRAKMPDLMEWLDRLRTDPEFCYWVEESLRRHTEEVSYEHLYLCLGAELLHTL